MTDASFLPDDYLAHQAEKRTNVISLTLFVVVMFAVFGAFLVTNRHSSSACRGRSCWRSSSTACRHV